jgi:selenide, water dikinase
VGVDPVRTHGQLADGSLEPYDLCSVAVGSLPSGLDLPGVRAHARALKPLSEVAAIIDAVETMARRGSGRVVVVGGGVAGVEIGFGVAARLGLLGARGSVTVQIVGREPAPAMDRGARVIRRVQKALDRNGITYTPNTEVVAITPDSVETTAGALAADLVIWATGPAAPPWLAETGLATDERGFLLVDDHLRSVGMPDVLAAGDCATLDSHRCTDKAGVYAVRMGPRLVELIQHALGGAPLPKPYTPQRNWLALLNTGDGRAIASRNGFALEGEWAMRWKDRIDRMFMERFRKVVGRRS